MRKAASYDRARVLSIVADVVNGKAAPVAAETAREVARVIQGLAERGEWWANQALLELTAQALTNIVAQQLKRPTLAITIGWNGELVHVPERLAVPTLDDDGEEAGAAQYPLWIEQPWDVAIGIRNRLQGQRDRLGSEVAAITEVIKLRERFPDSATPLDACEMAGIDPRSFSVTAEAVA